MANSAAAGSQAEEESAASIFKKFDANGDGKISVTEFCAILNSLGSATTVDKVAVMMSELDKDGDGFMDLNEFKAFYRSGAVGGGGDEELKAAFDLYDKDKNGKISATELHSVLRSIGGNCTIKDCRRMIASVDVDGDGCVNFAEFKKMMSRPS